MKWVNLKYQQKNQIIKATYFLHYFLNIVVILFDFEPALMNHFVFTLWLI